MRTVPARALVTTALLAAAALAAPAGAAGAGPCGDPGSSRVARVGTSTAPVATPGEPLYFGETAVDVLVELPVGDEAPTAADVAITLAWDNELSDFDLKATGPGGEEHESIATNALEGPTETVTVPAVGQCDSISVVVQNFAGLPVEELTLTTVATPVEE